MSPSLGVGELLVKRLEPPDFDETVPLCSGEVLESGSILGVCRGFGKERERERVLKTLSDF